MSGAGGVARPIADTVPNIRDPFERAKCQHCTSVSIGAIIVHRSYSRRNRRRRNRIPTSSLQIAAYLKELAAEEERRMTEDAAAKVKKDAEKAEKWHGVRLGKMYESLGNAAENRRNNATEN